MSKAKKILTKLSYPILGNLSTILQERLEDKLNISEYNKNFYDGSKATLISSIANLVPYACLAYNFLIKSKLDSYLNNPNSETMDMLLRATLVGVVGISAEFFYRLNRASGDKRDISVFDAAKEIYKNEGCDYIFGGDAIPCGFKSFRVDRIEKPTPVGSLIGKLISLPIEKIINYVDKRRERKFESKYGFVVYKDS